jgi:hypothetical protein
MINASKEFRNLINKGVKVVNYADITLKDGTVLNLGPSDFSVGGFSMTDKTSNGKFEIGTAIAKTINVTIANHTNKFSAYDFYKSIIYMYVAVEKEDGTVLKERKGKYYVINPTAPGDTIKLSGVDSMYLFDKPYNTKKAFPATLQSILADCCTNCGVNIGFGEFDNWNFEVMNPPKEGTYRQVVSWVAQIAGCQARISNNDYLELVWYDTSSLEKVNIDGGNYFVYDNGNVIDGGNFTTYESDLIIDGGNFTDYAPPNVTKIKPPTVSTDNVVISGVRVEYDKKEVLIGSEDYLINVKDNPFVADKENEVCQHLADKLIGVSFRPLFCQMVNNPLFEPFDSCYVYDRKGNVYFTLINSVTYTISGFTTLSCNAEDPIRNETSYVSESAKAVVQARREASELANQAQIAAEKNAEAKAAELASKAATEAYEEAEKKAQQLAAAAQQASGEEAARLADAAREAAEEAAQLKANAAKAEAIAEAAIEASELANQALEEAKRYSDGNLTLYDKAVQNMNLLAANSMGLYRETEIQSDGSAIYYMSNRPITKSSTGVCSFESGSVVYKMTGDGFFVSEDGGLSYTAGFDSEGNAIVNVLSAIGITFDWAKGGTISLGGDNNINGSMVVYDAENNIVGRFNKDGLWAENGYFKGTIESTDATITGGTIHIETSIEEEDSIVIKYQNKTTSIFPDLIELNANIYQTNSALTKLKSGSVEIKNSAGTITRIESSTATFGGTVNITSSLTVLNVDATLKVKAGSLEGTTASISILDCTTIECKNISCESQIECGSLKINGSVTLNNALQNLTVAGNAIFNKSVSITGMSTSIVFTVDCATNLNGNCSICNGVTDKLSFFGGTGNSKQTVSTITTPSTATTTTNATKINEIINALKKYNLL